MLLEFLQEWVGDGKSLATGAIVSFLISFVIAAYFSDHFHIPFISRRHRLFPVGEYYYYAPSRGEGRPIVKWKFRVKNWPLLGSYVRMETNWPDDTGQHHMVRYKGPIIVRDGLVIVRLTAARFRQSHVTVTTADGRQVSAAVSLRPYDPTFIVFDNNTANWSIRPGITSGFSELGDCYGGINFLVKTTANPRDSEIEALFSGRCFLDYVEVKRRVDDTLFGTLRQNRA